MQSSAVRIRSDALSRITGVSLLLGLAFATSVLGMLLIRGNSPISPIWFTSGILLGILLRSPTWRWPELLGAGLFGMVLAGFATGQSVFNGILFASCSALEIVVVAAPIRRRAGADMDPERLLKFARYGVMGAAFAPALSGLLVALVLQTAKSVPFWQTFVVWYPAGALGIVIMTPLVLVAQRRVFARMVSRGQRWTTFCAFGLLATTSGAVFSQEVTPLLSAILPPLLYVAFKRGFAGASIGVALVMCIGLAGTVLGHGPLALMRGASLSDKILALQFFMIAASLMVFPATIVLSERRTLRRTLMDSERRYRTLADYSSDIIVRSSLDGTRLYVSPAAEEVLGWTVVELLGAARIDLVHPDDRHLFEEELAELSRGLATSTIVYRCRHKRGHYIWVESAARRVSDAGPGQAGEIIRSIRDISKRKRAEEALTKSERMLRSVSDNIPAIVAYVDTDEKYRFTNVHFGQILDVDPATAIGKTMREVRTAALYADIEPYVRRALHGERVSFECKGRVGDPDDYFLANYLPDIGEDGSVIGFYAMTFDITAQKTIERRLEESEKRLRLLADSLPALVAHLDNEERYTFTNEHYRTVFGADPASFIGLTLRETLGDELYDNARRSIALVNRGEPAHVELARHDRGVPEYYQVDYIPDRDARGVVKGFYLMVLDITARKWAELQQVDSEQRLRTIADNLPVLIAFVDANGIMRFCNATYETWLGKSRDTLVGRPLLEALGIANFEAQESHFRRALAGERVEFELDIIGPDATRQARATYVPQREADGRVIGFYALTMDMTAIKRVERELDHLARFDSLTSLANRRQLDDHVPQALARARRTGNLLAVMFLDIDHFKSINDSIGHGGGDEVLQEFARRLVACVRRTDLVARQAGDEFVVVLESVQGVEDVQVIARKIISAMGEPFKLMSGDRTVSASIGIALVDKHEVSPTELMLKADEALYQAKAAGRNVFRLVVCGA